jgi:hypothetical protein
MASKVVDRGLQVIGGRASSTADSFLAIQAMSVDDKNEVTGTTQTNLNSPSNLFKAAFDSTPARTAQTVAHVMTLPADKFNGNMVRRVALHNAPHADVTGTSNTLVAAVDELAIPKTADLVLRFTFELIYQRPSA